MTTTVVIGGSFAGMTAALEIKRKGKEAHKVILIDKSPLFLFIPSLIWIPFKRREMKDISFKKEGILKQKGIQKTEEEIEEIKRKELELLENISGFSKDKAHDLIMKRVEEDMAREMAEFIKEKESAARLEANDKAKQLIVSSIM